MPRRTKARELRREFSIHARDQKKPSSFQRCICISQELDLKPGDVVVDIDDGNGWWSNLMAKQVTETGTVYAAEDEQSQVDELKRKFTGIKQIKPYQSKPDNIQLPENSCDLAFFSQVYHHLDDSSRVDYLKELTKVVKHTGRLCIIERYTLLGITPRAKKHGSSLSRLAKETEQAGWIPVRYQLITGSNHYIALFVQKELFDRTTVESKIIADKRHQADHRQYKLVK